MKGMDPHLSRQMALTTTRMIDNGVNIEVLCNQFQRQVDFQNGCQVLKERGEAALSDWIAEQMLAFFKAQEDGGGAIRQKGLDKEKGKEGIRVRVVPYGGDERERGRALIAELMNGNPNVSLKDATLEVGKRHPELFRQ